MEYCATKLHLDAVNQCYKFMCSLESISPCLKTNLGLLNYVAVIHNGSE